MGKVLPERTKLETVIEFCESEPSLRMIGKFSTSSPNTSLAAFVWRKATRYREQYLFRHCDKDSEKVVRGQLEMCLWKI